MSVLACQPGGQASCGELAWRRALKRALTEGELVAPRGQRTKELLGHVVSIDMARAVVTSPTRKLSYRFMCAEALWILAGQNELAPLTRFVKRMADFSDDGVTLAGAYGPRLVPQLPYVVDALARDRETRQAVVTIWTPSPPPSRDIPCLAGDTVIPSPEGDVTIAELARRKFDRFPVYAWNPSTRIVELTWLTRAWRSGRKRTVKVTFDDGSALVATPDHRLWLKERRHVQGGRSKSSRTFVIETTVGDLAVGDRVWATSFMFNPRIGKRRLFIRDLSDNWYSSNQRKEQDEYAALLYGPKPTGYVVHHRDNDRSNNHGDNLEYKTEAEHNRLHHVGDSNPMRRETCAANLRRRLRLRRTYIEKGWKVKSLSAYRARTNHVVVAIEPAGVQDVYDFEVPGAANAVVGTGVLVHNCTVAVAFQIRRDELHQQVFMRSSDLWLGIPYDMFSFSCWGIWVACALNTRGVAPPVGLGVLTVTAASSHLYERDWASVAALLKVPPSAPVDLCPADVIARGDWDALRADLERQREGESAQLWQVRP